MATDKPLVTGPQAQNSDAATAALQSTAATAAAVLPAAGASAAGAGGLSAVQPGLAATGSPPPLPGAAGSGAASLSADDTEDTGVADDPETRDLLGAAPNWKRPDVHGRYAWDDTKAEHLGEWTLLQVMVDTQSSLSPDRKQPYLVGQVVTLHDKEAVIAAIGYQVEASRPKRQWHLLLCLRSEIGNFFLSDIGSVKPTKAMLPETERGALRQSLAALFSSKERVQALKRRFPDEAGLEAQAQLPPGGPLPPGYTIAGPPPKRPKITHHSSVGRINSENAVRHDCGSVCL